jgi:transposase
LYSTSRRTHKYRTSLNAVRKVGYLKKPERIMALLMSMTACLLVSAALAYRIRTALKDHGATLPDQKGQPVQNPTARWIFPSCVGIPLLSVSGQWPLV